MASAAQSSRIVDAAFWRGRRVLLTGHTGFKGAWATLWLHQMGAKVTGLSLAPETTPNLHATARISEIVPGGICDLSDRSAVDKTVIDAAPEIVLHLAAQALVRRSVGDPIETFAANVMGTAHLLDAVRHCSSVKAVLVVTTDKVYENNEAGRAFSESDPLGGHDPYSASKAAAELVAASYAGTYFAKSGIALGTARGGNVIGGGDFSVDRIVPDVWRAMSKGVPVELRYPNATRPWQHVLDCLAGYLSYAQALAQGDGTQDAAVPSALNFGPAPGSDLPVSALVDAMQKALGATNGWVLAPGDHPKEMQALALDSSRARSCLNWHDRLAGIAAINATADWYLKLQRGHDMRVVTDTAIKDYMSS